MKLGAQLNGITTYIILCVYLVLQKNDFKWIEFGYISKLIIVKLFFYKARAKWYETKRLPIKLVPYSNYCQMLINFI